MPPLLSRRRSSFSGFTLTELLLVLAIAGILLTLLVPALAGLKSAGDINRATADIAGLLENARSYARANNTYVRVCFFEEDAASPGNPGYGRIVVSVIASRDGTRLTASPINLDPARLVQVNKLGRIENMHLADPSAGGSFLAGTGTGDGFEGRPPATVHIGAALPSAPLAPFILEQPNGGNWTFRHGIEFTPRGESRSDSSEAIPPLIEVGLQPTRGTSVDTASPNVAAIQISGIAGNVSIYRR